MNPWVVILLVVLAFGAGYYLKPNLEKKLQTDFSNMSGSATPIQPNL